MTTQVWCELRYGLEGSSVTLCRLKDMTVLNLFKRRALRNALKNARESEGVDEVVHLQDEMELERLERLLGLLIPDHRKGETLHV